MAHVSLGCLFGLGFDTATRSRLARDGRPWRRRPPAQLAVVAGNGVAETRLGRTLVVCPGRLEQGHYALIDLHELSVQARTLGEQASR